MTEEKIRTATNKIIRMAYDIKRENPSMSLDNAFKAIELGINAINGHMLENLTHITQAK